MAAEIHHEALAGGTRCRVESRIHDRLQVQYPVYVWSDKKQGCTEGLAESLHSGTTSLCMSEEYGIGFG